MGVHAPSLERLRLRLSGRRDGTEPEAAAEDQLSLDRPTERVEVSFDEHGRKASPERRSLLLPEITLDYRLVPLQCSEQLRAVKGSTRLQLQPYRPAPVGLQRPSSLPPSLQLLVSNSFTRLHLDTLGQKRSSNHLQIFHHIPITRPKQQLVSARPLKLKLNQLGCRCGPTSWTS